jgi:hypothetical protein
LNVLYDYNYFRNFTAHVNELNKIKEAMDLWIESYDTFCLSSSILSESFKTFFSQSPFKPVDEDQGQFPPNGPHSTYMNTAIAFDKIMIDISQIVQPSVRETFVNRCLKPTISILSLVPAISEQVQERRTVMLDFDSYKAKIQKEHSAGRDSAHPNVVRKAQKLDDSAKKLYTIQQTIVSAIDEYEAARPIMLGAEFTSFVACVYHQAFYTADLTSKLLPVLPQTASSLAIMDSFVLQKQTVTIGDNFLPSSAFSSSMFIRSLKQGISYAPVEAIVTRSEYLGGGYGGYSTGGPLQTSSRGRQMGLANGDDDEEDLRVASVQLVSATTSAQGQVTQTAAPLVEAVVIPFSTLSTTVSEEEEEEAPDEDETPYRTYAEHQQDDSANISPPPYVDFPTEESIDRTYFTAPESADPSPVSPWPTGSVGSNECLSRSLSDESATSGTPDSGSFKAAPPAKPPKSGSRNGSSNLSRPSTVDSALLSGMDLTATLASTTAANFEGRSSLKSVPPPPPRDAVAETDIDS